MADERIATFASVTGRDVGFAARALRVRATIEGLRKSVECVRREREAVERLAELERDEKARGEGGGRDGE